MPAICTQQQNNGVMQPISKQWIFKHASTTILLETVFSIQSMQSGYKKENLGSQFS
jgi:hypothetical protein